MPLSSLLDFSDKDDIAVVVVAVLAAYGAFNMSRASFRMRGCTRARSDSKEEWRDETGNRKSTEKRSSTEVPMAVTRSRGKESGSRESRRRERQSHLRGTARP